MALDFDPEAPLSPNGNYFGFPYTQQESKLILVSVPWDVTTSYRAGAAQGPQAIRQASLQLDFFDFEIPDAYRLGIGTLDFAKSEKIAEGSAQLRPLAETVIEQGEDNTPEELAKVNAGSAFVNDWLYDTASALLAQGKQVGVVGGDHSSPLGLMRALGEKHGAFGILHLDAHADLRKAYEGFTYSHASIMYNALQLPHVERLVQIGIRDVCQSEQNLVRESNGRIRQFSDMEIQKRLFEGYTWNDICREIIDALPAKVYVSFDIDALQPALCPHTGTPVPGGLEFSQARYLLSLLRKSGKQIIGFDLCEVAPNPADPADEWDGNVGSRILYILCNMLLAPAKA
ncbi:MAG: agmatinase family protein [Bacteroides sp.]|nr:agmatinase family protein [Ruminococcus flavefaciens]MCM1555362.1 agmatinase family protein [Bacteroides sp.]